MLNFKKQKTIFPEQKGGEKPSVPEGLWVKCPKCKSLIYKEDVVSNYYACTKCGGYFRIKAGNRIRMILDKGSFTEWDKELKGGNPLQFPEYAEKIVSLQEKTGLQEAVRTGVGTIQGIRTVFGVCDTRFLMGSMGYAVGEKITLAFERAMEEKLPVILFCCSGGARMQEGIVSLMQMAKTSAAIKRHSEAGLLYIPVLTDPTTGGVTASFAMLGDIILAEPGALIGFAGPRVIRQTIGEQLPDGFQKSEFLLDHGMLDAIVERENLKETLAQILRLHDKTREKTEAADVISAGIQKEENSRTAWEKVQTARAEGRARSLDYITEIFNGFLELHGDRSFGDDGAIVGGIADIGGQSVTVIGIQKGDSTKENIHRNFGMPSPEGYRKALRLMKQAEKFGRPVITFVDTPGAFPGIEAEERGQAEAIARNLMEMSALTVPVLSIVIGEGGSGGALALAVGNEVWMMENAVYSILSPEGFASILWKDSKRAEEAAEVMKITAEDLYRLGIIEMIIREADGITPETLARQAPEMRDKIMDFLSRYGKLHKEELVSQRYRRFRNM